MKIRERWIKFLCWALDHDMELIAEKVNWHWWTKWKRCTRCGHTTEETEFCC